MALRSIVSKSNSQRLNQSNFSELQTNNTLGPDQLTPNVDGEVVTSNVNEEVAVYEWVAMTQADQGLLDALYDFINTNKDGVSVTPNVLGGRTKKLFFNFYGTIGKSIMPGEIGQFEVNFSYSPQSSTDVTTTTD